VQAVALRARSLGLGLHLDGARIWNAAAATGRSEAELCAPFDTVSACLSKGLGAPVGSVLAGSAALITEARRFRKMLGGAMRQVGILSAGGLFALEHHRGRVHEDHANARRFAEAIADVEGIAIDLDRVQTNIVLFDVDDAPAFAKRMLAHDVLLSPFGPKTIRVVTHLDVSVEQVDQAAESVRAVMTS